MRIYFKDSRQTNKLCHSYVPTRGILDYNNAMLIEDAQQSDKLAFLSKIVKFLTGVKSNGLNSSVFHFSHFIENCNHKYIIHQIEVQNSLIKTFLSIYYIQANKFQLS